MLLVGAFLVERFEVPVRDNQGYRQAAAEILSTPAFGDSVLLIASDPIGEGLFVAGVALADERPERTVLRGSKVLGRTPGRGPPTSRSSATWTR